MGTAPYRSTHVEDTTSETAIPSFWTTPDGITCLADLFQSRLAWIAFMSRRASEGEPLDETRTASPPEGS